MTAAPWVLSFRSGTLELSGATKADSVPAPLSWDARSGVFRAPALAYAEVVLALRKDQRSYEDRARAYPELESGLVVRREPRPFQVEALQAWEKGRGRGVVVLPTGAGKSHVALMAIDARRRAALVVAPTLDLVRQWYDLLRRSFGMEVGVVGGGSHDVKPLTVTTYDSACLHMEHLGARFGLVVFDECHHLPGPSYSLAAELSLAPFRLGLTATPERADGQEARLQKLIGPTLYRKDIVELSGRYLADYEVERVDVELTAEERREYDEARAIYLEFVRSQGIRFDSPQGFGSFVMRSAQSAAGQRAMRAYRRQRELALASSAKLTYLEHLLLQHRQQRALVFTQDNATAYEVSRRFLIPVITHQTKVKERSEILERFAKGEYTAVATSKVLNEGVDVPDASVAIVLSGSGSVREHVQRLGRVLRRQGDKRAILYELVSSRTNESGTSERRREHSAYAGAG
ncbi:MAG: helicase [Polyangiaceae bacterium]|nr:helicase [Polyangiaceae bacterium]